MMRRQIGCQLVYLEVGASSSIREEMSKQAAAGDVHLCRAVWRWRGTNMHARVGETEEGTDTRGGAKDRPQAGCWAQDQ
eukprot:5127380-Pleurochrysis_carterae.AAC.2